MNYLTLVNNVLRRLREDEVTTVNQSAYSKLIGDLVNDAKTSVEQAWDWAALRSDITVNTAGGTQEYALVGSGENVSCILLLDNTNKTMVQYQPKTEMDVKRNTDNSLQGPPSYFSFSGIDSNGDTKITLYPTPADAYVLTFSGVVRQALLSDNADVISVPWIPVMHLALAFAARERGETGGTSTSEYFAIADKYLSDAISYDANHYPEELTFRVV